MSTGKRLAKRSIIGMRVCALSPDDGLYYPGRITSVKTPDSPKDNQNCINLTPNTRYSVRFDPNPALIPLRRGIYEFSCSELIGDGFGNITDVKLKPNQKIYITHNGRETGGVVLEHDVTLDEVTIQIQTSPNEVSASFCANFIFTREKFSSPSYNFVYKTLKCAKSVTNYCGEATMASIIKACTLSPSERTAHESKKPTHTTNSFNPSLVFFVRLAHQRKKHFSRLSLKKKS